MSYVNKVKKDNVEYDINDARLDEQTIDKLSALLSNVSVDGSTIETTADLKLNNSDLYLLGLAALLDEEGNPLFPFENNAGKVFAVNDDEDGLVAIEKGTQLYRHTINFTNGTYLIMTTTTPEPITANSQLKGLYGGCVNCLYFELDEEYCNVLYVGSGTFIYYSGSNEQITTGNLSTLEFAEDDVENL